jgi:hypothetical protein
LAHGRQTFEAADDILAVLEEWPSGVAAGHHRRPAQAQDPGKQIDGVSKARSHDFTLVAPSRGRPVTLRSSAGRFAMSASRIQKNAGSGNAGPAIVLSPPPKLK